MLRGHLHSSVASRRTRRIGAEVERIEARVLLSTFAVTNTNDAGPGSFREAILDDDRQPGGNSIVFDVGPTDPHFSGGVADIVLASELPAITADGTVIDGTTQPSHGIGQGLSIEITSQPTLDRALWLQAADCTIKGLVISARSLSELALSTPSATGDRIEDCYLGTDPTGSESAGTMQGGIVIYGGAHDNVIGGAAPEDRNVISGAAFLGININEAASSGNVIQNNFVGVNAAGSAAVPNGNGIYISIGAHDTTVANNVISGNAYDGIILDYGPMPGGEGNVIRGNYIGVDATGSYAVPNGSNGVEIGERFYHGTVLGGTSEQDRNVISGNGGWGVLLHGGFGNNGTLVEGNYIGTDATGAVAVPNAKGGVYLLGSPPETYPSGVQVGTATAGGGNLISGNGGPGVQIEQGVADIVQNNAIGLDASGKPLGNSGDGVYLLSASQNLVKGNTIADNGRAGVEVSLLWDHTPGDGNTITSNIISSNRGLGIDLGGDGVTPNTPGGPHAGPNRLQNFPVLTYAASGDSGTLMSGTLTSTPNTIFRVELFSNAIADPSGYGPGEKYLGYVTVITDIVGNGAFTFLSPFATPAGRTISATATDSQGDTSEFSADRKVQVMGDADGDGEVGFSDLVILARHYSQEVTPGTNGDFNGDGSVGFDDMVILARNYRRSVSPAAAQAQDAPTMTAQQMRRAMHHRGWRR